MKRGVDSFYHITRPTALSTPRAAPFDSDTALSARVRRFTNEELSDLICRCEAAIADGSAEIEDYEAFVLAQQELARRTWS